MIGCRQVFVRFAECNLSCAYCDTPFTATDDYRVETTPGSGQFATRKNPALLDDVTALIASWQQANAGLHHSVVLTGGEPLLQADLLCQWLPTVRPHLPIFLETNGTLPAELEKILPLLDWISMDIKSGTTSGQATLWNEHEAFLAVAKGHLCQVKMVVDEHTTEEELGRAAQLVAQYAPTVPLVIQPRTFSKGLTMSGSVLLKLQAAITPIHQDIRIIPQVHPWFGVA